MNFLDNIAQEDTRHKIISLVAEYILGESQFNKLLLRYDDMMRNFDCVTFDEWDGISVSDVWKFSSGVTPYKDYDDTSNVPIPITKEIVKVISNKAVTSLDLPTWFNLSSSKVNIILLSQDPMPRSEWYDDCRDAVCSSPFGLHSKTWREKGNGGGRIWGLIKNLISNNIGVYLTDLRKFYFRTADDKRKYIAATADIENLYRKLLKAEISVINPSLIVTLGNQSTQALKELLHGDIELPMLNLPHFSGQAQGKIKEFFNIPSGHKFTVEEQIKSYADYILKSL